MHRSVLVKNIVKLFLCCCKACSYLIGSRRFGEWTFGQWADIWRVRIKK